MGHYGKRASTISAHFRWHICDKLPRVDCSGALHIMLEIAASFLVSHICAAYADDRYYDELPSAIIVTG